MKKQTLTNHEQKYIHIPKRSFGYGLLTLLLIFINIGIFQAIVLSWKFLELGDLTQETFP